MIVFVDGVDGTGKTTLINELADRLGPQAVSAPPLWRFLPITTAGEFPSWVTRTPAITVAVTLLDAMSARIARLPLGDPRRVVLVDRGPATVAASAAAHAGVGRRDREWEHARQRLDDSVTRLLGHTDTVAVQFDSTHCMNTIMSRVLERQDESPRYLAYLQILAEELARALPRPGLRTHRLDPTAALDTNITTTLAVVTRR